MNVLSLPVRRPVATAMFFLAVLMLGVIAWLRIPVELMPPVAGNELFIQFSRPGSEPAVVEREMLLPLEARVSELADVDETWAQINDSSGTMGIRFASHVDLKVRELELRRVGSELVRNQPRGSSIDIQSQDLSAVSRFVMVAQITGMDDRNALLDFVEERIEPRLLAVPDVSQVLTAGGQPREVTVEIDPDRCASAGVFPQQVTAALARAVRRLDYLGGTEDEAGRTAIVLDGRPEGLVSLANLRVDSTRPVLLRHVAEIDYGTGQEFMRFRVNGQPTVGMILFQDDGANLIRLGHNLREKMDELREEFAVYGIDFVVNFDAAETVEEQLDRLKTLAVSGFFIALAVLYLFLRQWRAVGVVAVAVPGSLLAALSLLFLAGQSINLITLFGLAVGIGMLVDNSIVVYEAVQRRLEQGADPDTAAVDGVRRTVRAILAASVTNAVVFVPVAFIDFEQTIIREILVVMALAIILPVLASVIVAIGLVPLLARRLAAPAAIRRILKRRRQREHQAGLLAPDRPRALFSAGLVVALRRPGAWVALVVAAVVGTVIFALPQVIVSAATQEPPEAKQLRFNVTLENSSSLDTASSSFERLETAAMELEGVEIVEAVIREDGGALTVHLPSERERPEELNATRVREVVRGAAREISGLEIGTTNTGFGGGGGGGGGGGNDLASVLGQGPASVVLSGPDSAQLNRLAIEIQGQLQSIPEVGETVLEGSPGQPELRVSPDLQAMHAFGLLPDQVLPALNILRREGVPLGIGFTTHDGREIPMTVRRIEGEKRAQQELSELRLATPAGVLPLSALSSVRRMPATQAIIHHNGRREISVDYRLSDDAPKTGPARKNLDEQLRQAIQGVHRPAGYTIEAPEAGDSFDWFKTLLVPVLLLLYAVLAVTFESMTLPLLVLLALPLTILGATWALFLAGMPADMMALVGALALIGLTVNPAILLVDRMQTRAWQGGMPPGAAALAAVRERARPVLMTATTTVAGLWPLALVTGRENEIWPPFATIVMGGLITSTLLTLLVIPVGFVFLHRLDRLFGKLGPWIVIAWAGATAAVMTPLIVTEQINSLTWQVITTLLVAALLLGIAVWIFRRPERPEPHREENAPPLLRVTSLYKIYDRPGPVRRAWWSPTTFAHHVRRLGGQVFDPSRARAALVSYVLVLAAVSYLAVELNSVGWRVVAMFVAAWLASRLLLEARRARGLADEWGKVLPGGVEGWLAFAAPWVALATASWVFHFGPRFSESTIRMHAAMPYILAFFIGLIQAGRNTAKKLAAGQIEPKPPTGRLKRTRGLWRSFSRWAFGRDLPRGEVRAVSDVSFEAAGGMVGILGPNGAGKTTMLRNLAGILDPTVGTIRLGGVRLEKLRRYLARYIGYLPQDFGLPTDLTAREYLEYYALLYGLPAERRNDRIERLLTEVGLGERANEKIGGYSGGMRQRVAVARTLLRLPPVIIVDEPTVGLDPRERIRFRNLLSRLAEGRIVLFSTHVVEDVEVACERVIVMAGGRMVFDGPPADLSRIAEGRAWIAFLLPGEEESLPEDAQIVDEVPQASGASMTRILCSEKPHPEATADPPSLQDGYLWLVGKAGAEA
ncbi:MAG: ATP-binding cassette domain-containing protein [Acidobacteria bacterium]|nr:ATP-binding cassette domain-containing protein [Acidobacteriota bacterium]NIM61876.1 ATP-binding cassette domain-containing protein [Acidobacteriota bacterium]NIO60833.1 ATP-binding cassette domain-containing protein [Acidobacteriota bacterium]NIQ31908.1 ATP-binding cassette domain-containing protein [Acidobacteriota bacterium]NIQ87285.1 ATP-binding cassette domain-containing protein [Acidobacteriota bacterium]